MPKPRKRSNGHSEKERYEILFEDVNSKMDLVLEGLKDLTERMERVEHRLGTVEQRMEQMELRMDALEAAVSTHTKEIQRLQADVHVLPERFEEHLKAHAA